MEMVNQMALCVSTKNLQSNSDACVRKDHNAKDNGRQKRKPEYVKVSILCSNITQQTCHSIAPDPAVDFNTPC
jgi:hypothetical protein